MARTKRRKPTNRTAQAQRLEREWERQANQQRGEQEKRAETPEAQPVALPADLDLIRQEAEAIINAKIAGGVLPPLDEKAAPARPFSVQSPSGDYPSNIGHFIWWTGGTLDQYVPVAEYGQANRQRDLRAFAQVAQLCLIAEAALIKKCQALQWTVEGGRNTAMKYQRLLNGFEAQRGWDTFIGRWVRAYCESDNGGLAELIRAAPRWAVDENYQLTPRGEAAVKAGKDASWPIVDARVMDPVQCYHTDSREYPLIYYNPSTGKRHLLRRYQFMELVDMPNVDDRYPGAGMCAVSRAVWAAQEDRMVVRYAMERMSENPGAGIVTANVNTTLLETALKSAEAEREARGVVYYKGVVFLPILNPEGSIGLEFLNFAALPENFDRTATYNILKEEVAAAFGLDVLEMGSIPGGNLGTAQQATVAAAKGRGKGVGVITIAIEREFRTKLLPESVEFNIKKHEIEEEQEQAELAGLYFDNAAKMVQVGAWMPDLANQYLADMGAIPNEPPYLLVDLTPDEEVEDTEAAEKRRKREGPRVRVDRDGKVTWVEAAASPRQAAVEVPPRAFFQVGRYP